MVVVLLLLSAVLVVVAYFLGCLRFTVRERLVDVAVAVAVITVSLASDLSRVCFSLLFAH